MLTDQFINEAELNKEIKNFLTTSDILLPADVSVQSITYRQFLKNKLLMIQAIRVGLPISLFNLTREMVPFSDDEWADILDISRKTLQRYEKDGTHSFKRIQSEKILEIAEVVNIGLELFGERAKFNEWLQLPSFALGNSKPVDLIKTSFGKDLVLAELTRIGHGIFV